MIQREDVLSMEYLKKTEYTGCHQGMRFRMEKKKQDEGDVLLVTIWPEPFNFFKTPEEQKTRQTFTFNEDGVVDAIGWMNDMLFDQREKWENASRNWDNYGK